MIYRGAPKGKKMNRGKKGSRNAPLAEVREEALFSKSGENNVPHIQEKIMNRAAEEIGRQSRRGLHCQREHQDMADLGLESAAATLLGRMDSSFANLSRRVYAKENKTSTWGEVGASIKRDLRAQQEGTQFG